jgi:ActR/RegA family two-component response regulator
MTTLTFDTLKFAERLQKAGFAHDQAVAIVEAQRESISEALDTTLATKVDIRLVRDDSLVLQREIAVVKGDMSTLKWMMGMLIALAVANFSKQYF